tara:strand:- start:26 stop:838 length:813 start_codon:yes stop_codon:yes gene_type:complete
MDSTLEKNSLKDFIKISSWLKKNGFSAPNLYSVDERKGLLLLEDFEENKFSILLKKNKTKKIYYYKKAIDLLTSLSKVPAPKFINKYDDSVLYKELNLYLVWHLGFEKSINKNEVNEWVNIWKKLFKKIEGKKPVMVLRDFHVDNIFYLKERSKEKKIGLIDFQDDLIGHPAYDLVSLLQDVRVFLSKEERKYLYKYFVSKNILNKEKFYDAYLILGTQRLLKIIGIFKRLSIQENKHNYIKFLPRANTLLKQNLKNKIFYELRDWISSN